MRQKLLTVLGLVALLGMTDAGATPQHHGEHFFFLGEGIPIGLESTATGKGYWTVDTGGKLFDHGDAVDRGDVKDFRDQGRAGSAPVADIKRTPDGQGYWIADVVGGIFTFGNAPFLGSIPQRGIAASTIGMAVTPDGQGYWLLDGVGGVHAFGTAEFFGSLPGRGLAIPVVAIAATPDGLGYWILDSVGGVHAFGSAEFLGSLPGRGVAALVADIAAFPGPGQGYYVLDVVSGVHAFGAAPFFGSPVGTTEGINGIDLAVTPDGSGYWVLLVDGSTVVFPGGGGAPACETSYPDICVAPAPPDINCSDIPFRDFRVFGSDPHGFDLDDDFKGCETGSLA